MIRKEHRVEIAELARESEAALALVALGVADAASTLIAGCTAAVVVVGVGSEWKLLAQRGPEDLSRSWRRVVAGTARAAIPSRSHPDALVAPFASTRMHAMLVLVPVAGISLPSGARRIVQPLLDAGGILLDAALSSGVPPAWGALRLVAESHGEGS